MNNESNVSSIIKEYVDKYGKPGVKFGGIKEPISNNSINISQNVQAEINLSIYIKFYPFSWW